MSHPSVVAHPRGAEVGLHSPILFHSLVVTQREHRRGRTGATVVASTVLHGALATTIVLMPLLFHDTIPLQEGLPTFLVPPLGVPAPPPPPPPAPAGPRPAVRPGPPVVEAATNDLVPPIDVPSVILVEKDLDLGIPGAVVGGVDSGVPGGVPGGVMCGLTANMATSPPKTAPVRVGGHVRRPAKIKDVAPEYPPLAQDAQIQGVVILECTLSPKGTVTNVKVLRGLPLLNDAAVNAVRQWIYTPTLLNGIPVPVIMTVTVTFRLRS